MIAVGIKADLSGLHRSIIALGAKQVPFAMSLALNELAKGVAAEERDLLGKTFKTPTPFTENAYRIEVATKSKPVARVAAKDIQAQYLKPYVIGGARSLGAKRAMLAPRDVALNRYGNLPRNKLAALKGKPNVYIGPIRTKKGKVINGVWQRPTNARRRGDKGASGSLKLLIQFEDTTPVPKRLPFEQRARAYISRNAQGAFARGLQRALATARGRG